MARDQIEAALDRLGWRVTDGPTRTTSGWKATIQRGTASMLAMMGSVADISIIPS